jgi:Flp pilus assembly protein TadG
VESPDECRRDRIRIQQPTWEGARLRRKTAASPHERRGQSTVEFAVVAPVFFLLVMSILGFGLLFENKVALDNSVRSAARYTSSHPDLWTNIVAKVQKSGGTVSIPTANITITYAVIGSSGTSTCGTYSGGSYTPASGESSCLVQGSLITVQASTNYRIPVPVISKIVSLFYPSGVPISSSASMWEDQPCASTCS